MEITTTILELFHLLKRKLMRFNDSVGGGIMVPAHIQILVLLHNEGTLSVSEIGKKLMIAKPNMTPLIARLAESGLVARTHSRLDRMTIIISITDLGEQFLTDQTTTVSNDIAIKLDELPEKKLCEFREALDTLKDVLSDLAEES